MKQILKLVFLLVIGQIAFAQAPSNYTNINGRYRWIAGMFDSTFHIPKGTNPSLRTGGSTNAGALFYKTGDSSLYIYTGTQWLKIAGAAGFVPYSGATQNVNLGIYDILAKSATIADTGGTAATITQRTSINTDMALYAKAVGNRGFAAIIEQADSNATGTQYQTIFRKSMMPGTGNPAPGAGVSWYTQISNDNNNNPAVSVYRARIIDSTGYASGLINQTSTEFWTRKNNVWDTTLVLNGGNVGINTGQNGIDSALTVANGTWLKRGVRMSALPTGVGTKALRIDANGNVSTTDTTTTTGYVPYTGATQDLDMGTFSVNAKSFHIKGTAGQGHLGLKHQTATPSISANESGVYADVNGDLGLKNDNLYTSIFKTSLNSADRTYTFQNKSYTIADSADVAAKIGGTLISGYLTKATGTNSIDTSQIYQNNGNIGIGTISPASGFKVDMVGSLRVGNGSSYNNVTINGNGSAGSYLRFQKNGTNKGDIGPYSAVLGGVPPYSGSNDDLTYSSVGGHFFNTNAGIKMYLNNAGNLGLSASPDSMLTVLEGAYLQRGVRMSGLPTGVGTKAVRINANGTLSVADTLANGISGTGTTNYIPKFTSSSAIGNSQIFDNGSAVGIGTVSPSFFLDLQRAGGLGIRVQNTLNTDDAYLQATTTLGSALFGINATGQYLYNGSAIPILFYTNATERMRLTSGGSLGIGTSNPSYKFQVEGGAGYFNLDGSGTTVPLYVNNSSTAAGTQVAKIAFASSGSIKSSIAAAVYGNDYMTFNVGSDTERMRLDASGNLGLGTSSPGANFEIVGGSGGSDWIRLTRTGVIQWAFNSNNGNLNIANNTASTVPLVLTQSGNLGLGVTPSAWASLVPAIQINNAAIAGNNNADLYITANAYFNSGWKYIQTTFANLYQMEDGVHSWHTAPSGTAGNAISFTQAMTLDASGRLGIGVTNPTYNLDLNSAGATTVRIVGDGQGYTQGALLLQSATTNSPQSRGLGIYTFNEGTDATWYFGNGYGYADAFVINRKAGTTYSIAAAAPAESSNLFTITSSGNVGIGTTSPSYKLEVAGGSVGITNTAGNNAYLEIAGNGNTLATTSMLYGQSNQNTGYVWNRANANILFGTNNTENMRLTSAGELLINTTSDAGDYKLQVNGDTYLKGSVSTSSTNALLIQNSSSTNLFAVRNDGLLLTNDIAGISSSTTISVLSSVGAITGINLRERATSTITSGVRSHVRIQDNIAPTSGTAVFTTLLIDPTINQTGGANGETRGIYMNPTLTSAAKWRSFEWTNNTGFGLYGSGTADNYLAGTLGIGTTTPNASALLDVSSTTKGFLPPRMTGAQAEAIATPAAGLMIYANNGNGTTITSTGWWGYDGTTWVKLN